MLLCTFLVLLSSTPSEAIDFARDVQPILASNCYLCHGPDPSSREAGLRLDLRSEALASAIVAGRADQSELIQRITAHDEDRMPPDDRPALSHDEIEVLRNWIDQGANWSEHWCWRPLADPHPPNMQQAWCRDPIDGFVLSRLESVGLEPAPEADRATLLRRLNYDLVGLPPTAEELAAFESDDAPDAWERVVDRLLASPRFGERWARHWLDVVRYAETCGHEFDYPIPHAWKYRDWVIRAINEDVPYDQFVLEQLAGDLVETPRRHPVEGYDESIIGTGFWFLSQSTHAPVDVRQDEANRIENQVDVMGKAFLGLTIACARCHDHKFDPISTADYYALAGFLQSSRRQDAYLDPGGRIADAVRMRTDWNERLLSDVQKSHSPRPLNTADPASGAFESFNRTSWADWFDAGHAFSTGPINVGQWYVSDGQPRQAETSMASSDGIARELQGTLRSPTFLIDHDRIHLHARGRDTRIRLIIDGFLLNEYNPLLFEGFIIDLDSEQWQSHAMDTSRYHGHRAHLAFIDDGPGWIDIDEIQFNDEHEAPWPASPTVESPEERPAPAEPPPGIPEPLRALAITDGTPENEHVFIRGRHAQPGPFVERQFLEVIAGNDQPVIESGSGRLELADRLLDASNPLPARVMVNRTWMHLMGRGLSSTTDDFGLLGQAPTHPELLDALARDFQDDWSLKQLIRRIVLSNTYRMASINPDARCVELDPQNMLLHRMNRRRLQGEAIRDAVLMISGELDTSMYGPPVPVHLTDFMTGRGRPGSSGPLDGAGRRSIYQEVRRNFLPPMMLAFDLPIPSTCQGRRHDSNVPAQALAMMNDPFIDLQSQAWADRITAVADATDERRVRMMYLDAYGRPPSPMEARRAVAFVAASPESGWDDLAHVMFNSKEFIFID
ncbi:MAG: PSD1 and planctomycete cytochrome C domain-containing protein [Phycisphaerales bacterium]|nr:PSD1 and planctomycete cytochrome C domain-containing protein [Phycisphaerales bacterium]